MMVVNKGWAPPETPSHDHQPPAPIGPLDWAAHDSARTDVKADPETGTTAQKPSPMGSLQHQLAAAAAASPGPSGSQPEELEEALRKAVENAVRARDEVVGQDLVATKLIQDKEKLERKKTDVGLIRVLEDTFTTYN